MKPIRLSAEPIGSIDDIIAELEKHRYESPLVGTCFSTARALNLTREQTFAFLAYHAVRLYEQAFDREVEKVMLDTHPPFIVPGRATSNSL